MAVKSFIDLTGLGHFKDKIVLSSTITTESKSTTDVAPSIKSFTDYVDPSISSLEAGQQALEAEVVTIESTIAEHSTSISDLATNKADKTVFSTSEAGLVPAASGTGATSKFLRGDGEWAEASAGGDAYSLHSGSNGQAVLKKNGAVQDTVTVYTHPGSGTNPHGTTKGDVGLGNVENKSSETIRGEITSTNVTTALGYTPATNDHTHGNITNDGKVGSAADKLLITTTAGAVTANSTLAATGLASGATPTVTLSGGTLTFGIPAGAQGPVGPTGSQGPKGDDGLTTSITMNGTTYTQSAGNINIGTVITAHQDISGKADKTVFSTTADGLVPAASGTGATSKFLRGDGTWQSVDIPEAASYSLAAGSSNGIIVLKKGTTIQDTVTAYAHPVGTAKTLGLYKVEVDGTGHVADTLTVVKDDIVALGIPAQDTTYNDATTAIHGLMSTADKTKLNGVEDNANNYTHPTHTAIANGLYKIAVDEEGHVYNHSEVAKSDITALGIPGQDTVYADATTTTAGLMSTTDKSKLNGIEDNANNYVHPNTFTAKSSSAVYKFTVDTEGHVTAGEEVTIPSIAGLVPESRKVAGNALTGDISVSTLQTSLGLGSAAYTASTAYATAAQGSKADTALQTSNILDSVASASTTDALSANMGKTLSERIDNLASRGRFLAVWNCTTGKPTTEPTDLPYTYRPGDYFIVGTVGTTNYRPNGSSYTGAASTTVETETVASGDTYLYDSSVWVLQHNTVGSVTFQQVTGDPMDNTNLAAALNAKAGTGVFSTSANGLVPKASATGDTGKFLRGDGTWQSVAGAVTSVNGQTGAVTLAATDVGAYDSSVKIAKTDLASGVQNSLDLADSALQFSALTPYRTSSAQDTIDAGKASASDLTDHTSDATIHVTASDKTTWDGKYTIPSGGIPEADLTAAVQDKLNNSANAAIMNTTNNGSITFVGTVTANNFAATSLRSMKENIEDFELDALALINEINVVSFNFKDDAEKNYKVGFIADDTDSIFSTKDHNCMDLYNTVGVLIKAVQELSEENRILRSMISSK